MNCVIDLLKYFLHLNAKDRVNARSSDQFFVIYCTFPVTVNSGKVSMSVNGFTMFLPLTQS